MSPFAKMSTNTHKSVSVASPTRLSIRFNQMIGVLGIRTSCVGCVKGQDVAAGRYVPKSQVASCIFSFGAAECSENRAQ